MVTPIYDPNQPPRPSAKIAQAQDPFQMDFLALYNAFKQNHVALDALTDLGNHTIIQLLQQTGSFQTNTSEISIYSKLVPGQADQIFLRYQGNANEFALSNYQIYSLSTTPNQYFSFLPGGLIVYFGMINVTLGNAPFSMKLIPGIAKNIMTLNFTPIGNPTNGANYAPWISLQQPGDNGIYTTINLSPGAPAVGGSSYPTQLFYVIMGNT
jgi:hypothetical protein